MLTVTDIIILIIGVIFLAIWLNFYAKGKKYAYIVETLNDEDDKYKRLYIVGYAAVESLGRFSKKSRRGGVQAAKFPYTTKHARALRRQLSAMYGEKLTDFYLHIIFAKAATAALTVLTLVAPLYCLSGEIIIVPFMILMAGLAFYYVDNRTQMKMAERSEEMIRDFSNVVSKLALMTNAGMIMREAWRETAFSGNTNIYREMQVSEEQLNNGASMQDALYAFGQRCFLPEVKKFTSTIAQGMVRGNEELPMMLQSQSKEVWASRKQYYRRLGEQAASKLLMPILIMFIGILIMVMVPIFTNLGV